MSLLIVSDAWDETTEVNASNHEQRVYQVGSRFVRVKLQWRLRRSDPFAGQSSPPPVWLHYDVHAWNADRVSWSLVLDVARNSVANPDPVYEELLKFAVRILDGV